MSGEAEQVSGELRSGDESVTLGAELMLSKLFFICHNMRFPKIELVQCYTFFNLPYDTRIVFDSLYSILDA